MLGKDYWARTKTEGQDLVAVECCSLGSTHFVVCPHIVVTEKAVKVWRCGCWEGGYNSTHVYGQRGVGRSQWGRAVDIARLHILLIAYMWMNSLVNSTCKDCKVSHVNDYSGHGSTTREEQ